MTKKWIYSITLSILFLFMTAFPCYAGALLSYPKFFATTSSTGLPLVGGKLYTYVAGSTTTNKATYTDRACTTPNTNPVILNSRGEATIYLTGMYNLILKDSDDVTIWSMDQVEGTPAGNYTFYPNPTEADHGTTGNGSSLKDILTAIGTSTKATVTFLHSGAAATTTYTVATTYDASAYSNVKFSFENGAVISVATTKTLTLPSALSVFTSMNQHIFTCVGTGKVAFSKPAGTVSVKWFGALGDASNDDTAEITSAFNSRAALSHIVNLTLYTYSVTTLYFPGGTYLVTDTITPTVGSGTIYSDENAVIYCSNDAKDIFDFSGGYVIHINGLKLSGGKRQIRFGNDNTANSELMLNNVQFHHNHSDAALEFYLVSPATTLSVVCVLNGCTFNDVYQCIESVAGAAVYFNDGLVTMGYVALDDRAAFVNKNLMVFNGMYGVEPGNTDHAGARWVDNYGDFYATHSRFGGDNNGQPIVYQYDVTRASYVGGGVVDLRSNAIVCGAIGVLNTIIHCMTGIPQKITIRDNDWIYKLSTSDFISVDATFDIATYIGALSSSDFIWIDIGNNASFVPLELVGLPALLTDTDKSKVIVSDNFKPYIKGFRKKALLHFDLGTGPTVGTTIVDEYLNQGNWTTMGDATLSTSVKRFGNAALSLDGSGDYVTNGTTTSLGSAFTVEGWWLTSDNTVQGQAILSMVNGSGYGITLSYNESASTHLGLYVSSNGSSWNVANATAGAATFSNNTWYKFVVEFDGATYKVYSGTSGAAVTADISVTSASVPCAITTVNLGNFVKGGLDEFRMLLGEYRYGGLFVPESVALKID